MKMVKVEPIAVKRITVNEESKSKPGEEKVDYVFKFSLPKGVARQFEELADKLKIPEGKLSKFFMVRGIRAFQVGFRPERMKAAEGKPARKKTVKAAGADNLVAVDLRNLSPKTLAFLRRFAAQQDIPLAKQIERSLDDGYGQAD
ncbi:MAG: hypothetical protein A3J65_02935 [Candidatus Buchananbacteria bacterium RIFCSPHIGHO2_02_FULL_45_11b]|uniref:Uncharacterized protein n=3 Tax=Candidatus Buchananiibacteriota TaxID=1817903 RepID=A0A1G1YPS6_9BACT|nr:MAG: hypothetical protein A2663_01935 [Candidatus Buchananbacteria bacterium RIFCSPHIGHO2_01_FULL_46_12]OGY52248.1 MAG: hypothetical protein A3J65_02935 [Candidatus Buchananbacteria bacterium RIFCSPHIGHO2_02_FULL_45_11b]OGY54363.1 MAG: hypothetical protein A3B15_02365 [Candidatus Buchananbacteria bacterium RIFCSPLOWO2_01_FULL_45_31]